MKKLKVNLRTLPDGLGNRLNWVEIEIGRSIAKTLCRCTGLMNLVAVDEVVMDEPLPDEAFHVDRLDHFVRAERLVVSSQGHFRWRSDVASRGRVPWETDAVPLTALLDDDDALDLRKDRDDSPEDAGERS